MTYKYFYRIKCEFWNEETHEWLTGSITEQFRNTPLQSRDFRIIRRHIFNEMVPVNVKEIRACIYRISDFDYPGIGEFDGTEIAETDDYECLCGRYIPLVGIVYISRSRYYTHYGWYDCGVLGRSKYHGHTVTKD